MTAMNARIWKYDRSKSLNNEDNFDDNNYNDINVNKRWLPSQFRFVSFIYLSTVNKIQPKSVFQLVRAIDKNIYQYK